MKERPILFSGPMVRAILEGRKTQTRRVIDTQPDERGLWPRGTAPGPGDCHYGQPGDHLWVRETWRAWPLVGAGDLWRFEFKADGATRDLLVPSDWEPPKTLSRQPSPWVPSIFLPHFASRLTLEVTDVRVQRLQEISEADAFAEGVEANPYVMADGTVDDLMSISAQSNFEALWDSINGERPGCSWEANPWVWAISFRRAE